MLETAFRNGDRLSGRFVVRSFTGRGPLGERYLALDEEVDVEVELRVVHSTLLPEAEARRQFIARMQRSRSFSHHGLLRVHDVFEESEHAVLAVQHAPGDSLATLLESARPIAFADARPMLGKVASALAHAHQCGVVLGDLRPATVVMTLGGPLSSAAVKVTSVGVALALPRDRYLGVVESQPDRSFLAPELLAGQSGDARSDVYSFAALVVVVLAGKNLVDPNALGLAEIPGAAELAAVVGRGVEADPSRRFPTVEAFLSLLDRAAERVRRRENQPVNVVPGLIPSVMGSLPRASTHEPIKSSSTSQPFTSVDAHPQPPAHATEELTPQAPQDDLDRLAGEISALLETTRQVSLEEIEVLRARSMSSAAVETRESAPDSGRLALGAAADRGRALTPAGEGDDDLSFDFSTQPRSAAAEPPRVDKSASRRTPRELPLREPLSRTPTSAAEIEETMAGFPDPFAGVNPESEYVPPTPEAKSRIAEPDEPAIFASEQDPFAAALEAHTESGAEEITKTDRRPAAPVVSPKDAPAIPGDESKNEAEQVAAATPSVSPPPLPEHPVEALSPAAPPPPVETIPPQVAPAEVTTLSLAPDEPGPIASPAHQDAAVVVDGITPAAGTGTLSRLQPLPPPLPVRSAAASFGEIATSNVARSLPGQAQVPDTASAARAPVVLPPLPPVEPPASRIPMLVVILSVLLALLAYALRSSGTPSTAPAPPRAATSAELVPASPTATPLPSSAETAAPANRGAAALAGAGGSRSAPVGSPSTPALAAPVGAGGSRAPGALAVAPVDAQGCPPQMLRVRGRRSFCVDPFEYPGHGQLPRTSISRDEAKRLCAERGARLCDAKEWEAACRGDGNSSFPYGNRYQSEVCNTVDSKVVAAGSMAGCRSRSGAYDMSGNVAEWIAEAQTRGGAAGEGNPASRCSTKGRPSAPSPLIGFRCCADATP